MLTVSALRIELEQIWSAPTPPYTPATPSLIDGAMGRLYHLLPDAGQIAADSKLRAVVEQFRPFVKTALAAAIEGKHGDLEEKLTTLDHHLAGLLKVPDKASIAITTALYQDAGRWAEHFSTVRMTVTTFLVGTSWGIISLKWDEYSTPLAWAASVLWALMVFFLIIFTRMTWRRSQRQKKLQDQLQGKREGLKIGTTCIIWLPVLVILILSCAFVAFICEWQNHEPAKKIQWTVLVEPLEQKIIDPKKTGKHPREQYKVVDLTQVDELRTAVSSLKCARARTTAMPESTQLLLDELKRIEAAVSKLGDPLQQRTADLAQITQELASIREQLAKLASQSKAEDNTTRE